MSNKGAGAVERSEAAIDACKVVFVDTAEHARAEGLAAWEGLLQTVVELCN